MKKNFRYVVRFSTGRSGMSMAGFLDMMRYDACVVTDWDHPEPEAWVISLVTEKPATIARWNSFGLNIQEK